MKTLFVDLETVDPNIAGELLRDAFFNQVEGLGCYQTFEWNSLVRPLKAEVEDLDDYSKAIWPRAERHINEEELVVCKYHWDGDGFLMFQFADGMSLFNSDCKKDNRWEWADNFERYEKEMKRIEGLSARMG